MALSSQFLSISKHRDVTASFGILLQHLTTFNVKIFFLYTIAISCVATVDLWEEPASVLYTLPSVTWRQDLPLAFPSSGQTNPVLSASFCTSMRLMATVLHAEFGLYYFWNMSFDLCFPFNYKMDNFYFFFFFSSEAIPAKQEPSWFLASMVRKRIFRSIILQEKETYARFFLKWKCQSFLL